MFKLGVIALVFVWLASSVPLLLLAAPWGTHIDFLGVYFYRWNSGMAVALPGTRLVSFNWESGKLNWASFPGPSTRPRP